MSKTIKLEAELPDFKTFLDEIAGLSEGDRVLLREIYNNAVADRDSARQLFSDLQEHIEKSVSGKDANHAMHGVTLAKYLERAHRSNEQLIKLAELINDARKRSEVIDAESVFDEIQRASA